MKLTHILFLCMLLLISCGKKEETNLQAFNAEAFAFQIDSGWEVNASVRVKGFKQNQKEDIYISKLSYTIGLVTPAKDTIRNIASDQLSETKQEEMMDLPVEVQIELDSSYSSGKYQLIFNIKDELSEKSVTAVKDIDLD